MSSGLEVLDVRWGARCLYCNKRWSHGVITYDKFKFELFFILFLYYFPVAEQLSYVLRCNCSPAQHISRGPLTHSKALRRIHIDTDTRTHTHKTPIHINIIFLFTNEYLLSSTFISSYPLTTWRRPPSSQSHYTPHHVITTPKPNLPPKLTPLPPSLALAPPRERGGILMIINESKRGYNIRHQCDTNQKKGPTEP